jgi:phosphotransferase system enzyme I (PtsI)
MAGDARLTRLLLGLGLRQFSMHPAHLLEVKQVVLKSDLQEAMVLTQKMLRADEPERLENLLTRMNR